MLCALESDVSPTQQNVHFYKNVEFLIPKDYLLIRFIHTIINFVTMSMVVLYSRWWVNTYIFRSMFILSTRKTSIMILIFLVVLSANLAAAWADHKTTNEKRQEMTTSAPQLMRPSKIVVCTSASWSKDAAMGIGPCCVLLTNR